MDLRTDKVTYRLDGSNKNIDFIRKRELDMHINCQVNPTTVVGRTVRKLTIIQFSLIRNYPSLYEFWNLDSDISQHLLH